MTEPTGGYEPLEEDITALPPGPLAAPPTVAPPARAPGFAPPSRPPSPPRFEPTGQQPVLPLEATGRPVVAETGSAAAGAAVVAGSAVADAAASGSERDRGPVRKRVLPAVGVTVAVAISAVVLASTGPNRSIRRAAGGSVPIAFGARPLATGTTSAKPLAATTTIGTPAPTTPASTTPASTTPGTNRAPKTAPGPTPITTPPSMTTAPSPTGPLTILPGRSELAAAYRSLAAIPTRILVADRRNAIIDGAGTAPHARMLRLDGRPEVLFVGRPGSRASAVERWSIVVALSQFGTFSGGTTTLAHDVKGLATPTFLFDGIRFSGSAVAFRAIELRYDGARLATRLSSADRQLWARDDPSRTLPWVDVGGGTAFTGPQTPDRSVAGHSFAAIVAGLRSGRVGAAFAIDGAAGALVSQICVATGQQPANVCQPFATGDG